MAGDVELLFRIKAESSQAQGEIKQLRKSIETNLGAIRSNAANAEKALSLAESQIRKMNVGNLAADYNKFSNALTNNSRNVRKSADEFLNLFDKVQGGTGHVASAVHEASRLGESFKVLSSAAVIADGPLGGIASRIRAMGTEAKEANSIFGSTTGILVGTGLAAGAAAFGLFELALKSAELGKQIFEVHEKTNFTTEAISAMRIPAEQTGLGLERLGAKLAGFNASLGNAQLGNKQFITTFKDMGVDIKQGVEPAFDQFLSKFKEMGPTAQRNALEAKLFKDRTGEMIPFLEKLGGSLERAKERAKELGLSFDEESARASRDFADRVELMKLGAEGFANRVGQKITPQIISALQDIGSTLGQNKNDWSGWADFVSTQINRILIGARTLAQDIGRALDTIRSMSSIGGSVVTAAAGLATGHVPASMAWQSVAESVRGNRDWLNAREDAREDPSLMWHPWSPPGEKKVGADSPTTHGGGKGKGKSQKDEIYKAELEASAEAAKAELETQRHLSESLKQAYELNIVTLENYYRLRQGVIDLNFNTEITSISREQEALNAARARGHIKAEEAAKKDAELVLRTSKAENKSQEETHQLRIEKQKALDKADLDLNKQLADIRVAQREGELNRITSLLDRQVITESEAINRRLQIEKDAHDDRVVLIDLELGKQTTSAERKIALDNLKIESEQRYTNTVEQLTQQRNDALARQAAQYVKLDTEAATLLRERALRERRYELEYLALTTGLNAKLIEAFRQLVRDEEQLHHSRIIGEIAAQEAQAHAVDEGGKHRLEIEQRYNALREQENKRFHQQTEQDDKDAERSKARLSGAGGFLSGLETGQITELKNGVQSFADVAMVAFSAVGAAVHGLAQGIGSLAQNWVLMGSQADVNVRKMVASVLAGVSAQAATMAVMSLAYAALATTAIGAILLGGTPAQFLIAAGLFAAVAAAAGLVGRAVAGNQFQNKSTATVAGGSTTAGNATPSTSPKPIEVDRRIGPRVTTAGGLSSAEVVKAIREGLADGMAALTLRAKVDPDRIVDMWIEAHNRGGRLRNIVQFGES